MMVVDAKKKHMKNGFQKSGNKILLLKKQNIFMINYT